jgi:hypothetical protein
MKISQRSRRRRGYFNNQLNEIVENEFHENIVSFVEENNMENPVESVQGEDLMEEETVFNNS